MDDLFFNQDEFLTVSELNQLVRDVINVGFSNAVWVCGEIQGYNRNKDKRHVFFELCEKDADSKDIIARIGLVIFAGKKAVIRDLLNAAENAFQLKDDIEVKFLCRVDFYPPHGAVRLVVESIDPVYTLGRIAQQKQKLINELKAKGILDINKALSVPAVPLRIGLITSFDSAAYNDFISELKLSGYGFKVFYRNALMQGKGAEKDVCDALGDLLQKKELDVIVITRGGGSIADLSCFDSKAIAQAIAAAPVPVFSGIGHEINITVTDLAAHTYQKTPTAIARLLVEKIALFMEEIEQRGVAIMDYARGVIKEERRSLKESAMSLQGLTSAYLKVHHQSLLRYSELVQTLPLEYIGSRREQVADLKRVLLETGKNKLSESRKALDHFQRIVDMADPANTLRRGFSITRRIKGGAIKSVTDVIQNEQIITQLSDGHIISNINKIDKEDKSGGSEIQ